MTVQIQDIDERWYGIGIGLLEGITTIWYICSLLTRRYPGASYKRFPSRQAAEQWMLRIHGIENPVLIDLAAAKAAVAAAEAVAAPNALPAVAALPAAVPIPSSSPPLSTPPAPMGQLLQLLQHSLSDPRAAEALKNLLSSSAASSTSRSNYAHAGGPGALQAPSSSPHDPVSSPRAPHTGRKIEVIDCTSDGDENPWYSRHMPTAVPPSSSAASSSTTSTTPEPRIRNVRLTQSPREDRSAKRARRTSGDVTMVPDLTFVTHTADMNDRFVNFDPALLRLHEILSRGNAVIITEDIIAAPGDDGGRSDTTTSLDQKESREEMNKSASKSKGKGKAQTKVMDETWFSTGVPQGVHRGRNVPEGRGIDGGNNSDGGDDKNDGDDNDSLSV